jgi:hypothetical protein
LRYLQQTLKGRYLFDGTNVSGAIVQGDDYKPSTNGVLAYLNGGNDSLTVLNKIEPNNRKVIVPKTQISPEMGFFWNAKLRFTQFIKAYQDENKVIFSYRINCFV